MRDVLLLRVRRKLSIIRPKADREHALAKSQWSFRTAVELSAALATKKVSAVELAQDAIARIERHDDKINAICVRDFDRGLAAARAADAALARGERKPLLGIPLTVKESYNIAGLPTTWGIPAQKDFTPTEDALSVSRVTDISTGLPGPYFKALETRFATTCSTRNLSQLPTARDFASTLSAHPAASLRPATVKS